MYRKIMVTLDGSKFAERAMERAGELASALDRPLVLLDVIEERRGPAAFSIEAESRREHRRAEAYLDGAKQRLNAAGIHDVEVVEVVAREPGRAIVDSAREHGCDVVVMATHGRSGLARALKGSVSDYVVRHLSGATVLLVPPEKVAA